MTSPIYKIAFYHRGILFNGDSIYQRPMGGTESALIYIARALAQYGHEVYVFNDCELAGDYQGVHYDTAANFLKKANQLKFDILISIRHLLPLLVKKFAKVHILLSPDAVDQPFLHNTFPIHFSWNNKQVEVGMWSLADVHPYLDAIFCVGKWQAASFVNRFNIPLRKLKVVYNGVWLDDFPAYRPLSERKKQIVYTSTPFRGLEYLLKYFPKIRDAIPDVECVVMSGMQLYGYSSDDDKKMYQHIYQLAEQPGVKLLGPLKKSEMNKILSESMLLAYPNHFQETFCIAALEAQAAGLPIVCSKLAGLEERVENNVHGYLIAGTPQEAGYEMQFVDAVKKILQNPILWEQMSLSATQIAKQYNYHLLAKDWTAHFEELLNSCSNYKEIKFLNSKVNVLVDGYPRQVEFAPEVLKKSFLQAGLAMGLL